VVKNNKTKWPEMPFLGLRSFGEKDQILYRGRENDIDLCVRRLFTPAVRVLVLQGLSGSGKSSFLRAGLIPRIIDSQDRMLSGGCIVPICDIISADNGLLEHIAKNVYEYVVSGPGRKFWHDIAEMLQRRHPTRDDFVDAAADDIATLLEFFSELSKDPRYPFLISIDQIENLWSNNNFSKSAYQDFLRLVSEFARDRFNGKLVLSIRTEHYGYFASKLPDSTIPAFAELHGVNRLCHHYLANPSSEDLTALINFPAEHYDFSYEDGFVETLIKQLQAAASSSEISVLPLVQTILLRLYQETKTVSRGRRLILRTKAFQALVDGAEQTSLGLLEDYVRWCLRQAIEQVMQHSADRHDWNFRQHSEMTCWLDVLREMSGHNRAGDRIRLQKSEREIGELAKSAECEANTHYMLKALSSEKFCLLEGPTNEGFFSLQHDLICQIFDRESTVASPTFWEQSTLDKRKKIERAHLYGKDDLFDGDAPPEVSLNIAELPFWDHKTLAYANHLGFFKRLGFSTECTVYDQEISATDIVNKSNTDPDALTVFSYPRTLMSDSEKQVSRNIVLLNSFSGFAIICKPGPLLPSFKEEDGLGSFFEIMDALVDLQLSGQTFWAEDNLAKKFFDDLLAVRSIYNFNDERPLVSAAKISVLPESTGIRFVSQFLSDPDAQFAIVTAPTWASAIMIGEPNLKTVIDQRSVLSLLDYKRIVGNEKLIRIRRNLEVRNSMNLYFSGEQTAISDEPVIMRLASVGLFLADWIWAQDELASEWIRGRWASSDNVVFDKPLKISRSAFLNAFRRSCEFVLSNQHSDRYYGDLQQEESSGSLHVHHKILTARMDYENKITELGKKTAGEISVDVANLIERAKKHAEINNYYDAKRLAAQAANLLHPEH